MTHYDDGWVQILKGNSLEIMSQLPEESVQCVVTSPPYWGLRKYEGEQEMVWGDSQCEHEWGDNIPRAGFRSSDTNPGVLQSIATQNRNEGYSNFCSLCGAWRGSFGLEPTPEMYVEHLVMFLREIRRVLKKNGLCFVNLGDSYAGSGKAGGQEKWLGDSKQTTNSASIATNRTPTSDTAKPLDLCLIPQQFILAAQRDGWYIRSEVIWSKPNPMPESVDGWRWERHKVKVKIGATEWIDCPGCSKCSPNDGFILCKGSWRPTRSHEYVFMLAKSSSYYADREAVKEASIDTESYTGKRPRNIGTMAKIDPGHYKFLGSADKHGKLRHGQTYPNKNLRSVWTINPQPTKESHFASFPEELVEKCILAATSEKGNCSKCGAPVVRVIDTKTMIIRRTDWGDKAGNRTASSGTMLEPAESKTIGWRSTCSCNALIEPALVLDPFSGTGTVGAVAKKLGRRAILIDTSEKYCDIAKRRIQRISLPLSQGSGMRQDTCPTHASLVADASSPVTV